MLLLSAFTFTIGYYPPPEGPKAPEYPAYSPPPASFLQSLQGTTTMQQSPYPYPDNDYQTKLDRYKEDQKTFIKGEILPYTKNVLVGWVLTIVAFEIIGMLLVKMGQFLVGGAYAFTGVWAIIFGPIGSLFWFASSLIASFAGRANQDYSFDPIMKALALSLIFGSVFLTLLGLVILGNLRLRLPRFSMQGPPNSPLQ